MSAANPYSFDDDLDADLFEDSGTPKHVLDGTICPTCGVAHDSDPIGGADIAAALLDQMPDDLAESLIQSLPQKSELIDGSALTKSLYGVVSNLDTYRPEASGIKAITHVLDAMTDGKVTALTTFFEVERRLVSSIYIKRRVIQLIDAAAEMSDRDDMTTKISYRLAVFWKDFLEERCALLGQGYTEAADKVDVEIDYRLVDEHVVNIDRTKALVKFFKFDELELGTSEIIRSVRNEEGNRK